MAEWSTDGVVLDTFDRSAATANVNQMLRILDAAAKPGHVGFDEDRMVELYRLWLIVGTWMRTREYGRYYGIQLGFLRAPGAISGNLKYSDLLRAALKTLADLSEKDNDSKHRRAAFDRAQERMFDFMYAFHTALAKQSKARAEAFRQKLQPIPAYVAKNYDKHWG
jgi:hypothetical protein